MGRAHHGYGPRNTVDYEQLVTRYGASEIIHEHEKGKKFTRSNESCFNLMRPPLQTFSAQVLESWESLKRVRQSVSQIHMYMPFLTLTHRTTGTTVFLTVRLDLMPCNARFAITGENLNWTTLNSPTDFRSRLKSLSDSRTSGTAASVYRLKIARMRAVHFTTTRLRWMTTWRNATQSSSSYVVFLIFSFYFFFFPSSISF